MLRLLFLTSIPRWSNRSRRRSDRRCIPAKKYILYFTISSFYLYIIMSSFYLFITMSSFYYLCYSIISGMLDLSPGHVGADILTGGHLGTCKKNFISLNSDLKNIILIPGNFQNFKLKSYLIYLP